MALKCKDILSKSSNKESAAITAAWECRGVLGVSEEAYLRSRAWRSVAKWWAEVVSRKCVYRKCCRICGQSDGLLVKQSFRNTVRKGL